LCALSLVHDAAEAPLERIYRRATYAQLRTPRRPLSALDRALALSSSQTAGVMNKGVMVESRRRAYRQLWSKRPGQRGGDCGETRLLLALSVQG
jgi:hypothetical protein